MASNLARRRRKGGDLPVERDTFQVCTMSTGPPTIAQLAKSFALRWKEYIENVFFHPEAAKERLEAIVDINKCLNATAMSPDKKEEFKRAAELALEIGGENPSIQTVMGCLDVIQNARDVVGLLFMTFASIGKNIKFTGEEEKEKEKEILTQALHQLLLHPLGGFLKKECFQFKKGKERFFYHY